jgi:hypothetical protein
MLERASGRNGARRHRVEHPVQLRLQLALEIAHL